MVNPSAPVFFCLIKFYLYMLKGDVVCRGHFNESALTPDIVVQHGILHLNMHSNH